MSQTKREFDATQLMQFKCGFDALSGEVLGMAVSGDPGDSIGGEQTITYIEVVETVDDFVKYLNVSASASIQVAFGHGGARAGWAETLSVHDYSVYVVVYISVTTGTKILQNPAFTHDAGQLLVQHPDDFRKQYGDEFLAGVTQGGEFIGFLEIRTKDQADQQQISAGLSGGGTFGAISGDASASLQQSISTLTSTQNLTLSTFQRGGSNAGLNQVTVNDLLQKATGFAATVTGADVFDYVAVFETYDILTPPTTPNPVDVQNQRDALEQLGLYKLRYMKVRDSIQYVLDNPGEFAAFDSSALTDKLNGINDFLNHLKDAASACFADLTKCKFPGFLVDPVVVLPQRLAVDVQTAVAAAQNSMTQANQAAVACKTHSDRIIQISQIIQVGPGAKALADEAAIAAADAATAATQAQDAASAAIASGAAYPEAASYVAAATASAQAASAASNQAQSLIQEIHRKGYSPYWNVPNTILLERSNSAGHIWKTMEADNDTAPTAPFGVYLSHLATDPSGGKLEFGLVGNVVDLGQSGQCTRDGLDQRFNGSRAGFYCYHGGSFIILETALDNVSHHYLYDLTGFVWTFSFKVKSIASGLETVVPMTAVCKDSGDQLGAHMDYLWKVV